MNEIGLVPSQQEQADRLAIQEVIFSHCRGLDRVDVDHLKQCYWSDAEVNYGFFKGNAHEFCTLITNGIVRNRATHHQVSNILVSIEGNDAVVESYVTAYHHQPEGQATEMTYFGRYVDHFQKRTEPRGDVWKMMFRHVVMDWNQNLTTTDDMETGSLSAIDQSARKPDDPLYKLQEKILGATD